MYRLLAFEQGESAEPLLDLLGEEGSAAVVNALLAYPPSDQRSADPFWGSSDDVHRVGDHFL